MDLKSSGFSLCILDTRPYNVSKRRLLIIPDFKPINGIPQRTFGMKDKLFSVGSTRLCISNRAGYILMSMGFIEQDSTVEAANLLARRSTRLKLSEKNGNDNRLRLPAEDMEVFPYPRRKPGASQRSLPLLLFPE